ncbi:MAG: hypothetical protein JWO70_4336 [Betaproteobacteria bacterium]|nr:hypothetical protein [Betaproteobacteria bacterium]
MTTPSAKAKEVLQKYWDLTLPVNVGSIAKQAGAHLILEPLEGFSGSFEYLNGKPTIRVSSTEALVRQRFTIAHELGHFVLGHPDSYRDGPDNFSSQNLDPIEVAANRFAAEILMPEQLIKYFVFKQGVTAISKLAKSADVSEVAMGYRLRNLGLIS